MSRRRMADQMLPLDDLLAESGRTLHRAAIVCGALALAALICWLYAPEAHAQSSTPSWSVPLYAGPAAPLPLPEPPKITRGCVFAATTEIYGKPKLIVSMPAGTQHLYLFASRHEWTLIAVEVATGFSCQLAAGKDPAVMLVRQPGEPA